MDSDHFCFRVLRDVFPISVSILSSSTKTEMMFSHYKLTTSTFVLLNPPSLFEKLQACDFWLRCSISSHLPPDEWKHINAFHIFDSIFVAGPEDGIFICPSICLSNTFVQSMISQQHHQFHEIVFQPGGRMHWVKEMIALLLLYPSLFFEQSIVTHCHRTCGERSVKYSQKIWISQPYFCKRYWVCFPKDSSFELYHLQEIVSFWHTVCKKYTSRRLESCSASKGHCQGLGVFIVSAPLSFRKCAFLVIWLFPPFKCST